MLVWFTSDGVILKSPMVLKIKVYVKDGTYTSRERVGVGGGGEGWKKAKVRVSNISTCANKAT